MRRPGTRRSRDASDVARAHAATAHAFRVDSRDAWLIAEDAWRAADDRFRADAVRRLRTGRRTLDENLMIQGFLEAYWLDAWPRAMEEAGYDDEVPSNITLETADRPPRGAKRAAALFGTALELANGVRLEDLLQRATYAEARRLQLPFRNPMRIHTQLLGYYLTMRALGHGISWTDRHACFEVLLPSVEGWALPVRRRRAGGSLWIFESSIRFDSPRLMCRS